ncbi:SAM-dependent methyltransferase [Pseudonocardia sichuanensis]
MNREQRRTDAPVAHSPRVWDYWLGGKDNYAVDRQVGDLLRATYPPVVDLVRSSRRFLARALQHLAGDVGLRQFVDVGPGLPTVDNTHEVVQRVAPGARVVYADNDPVVLAHARVLLQGEGTSYVEADLRDPAGLLDAAARDLDLDRPVGLVLTNVLGHLPDLAEARRSVRDLVAAVAPGSHLVVADGRTDGGGPFDAAVSMWNQAGSQPYVLRTTEQITCFLDGLELLEPGVVQSPLWRPDGPPGRLVEHVGAVGRKPSASA